MNELTWEQMAQILINKRPTHNPKHRENQPLTIHQHKLKRKVTPQMWRTFPKEET